MAFSTFQLLYMTLAINKMDRSGFINTACHERLPKETKVLATEGQPKSWSTSVKKVCGRMCSDAFKRRLPFSFTVMNSA